MRVVGFLVVWDRFNSFGVAKMNLLFRLMMGLVVVALALVAFADRAQAASRPVPEDQRGLAADQLAPGVEYLDYFGDGVAELGLYRVQLFDPISKYRFRVDFELMARTPFETKREFQNYMNGQYRTLRDQVATAVRTCSIEELRDPNHTIMSKKIITRVNRIFERRLFEKVELVHYRLFEKSPEGVSFLPLALHGNKKPVSSQKIFDPTMAKSN
jgi:hypothetical protein